MGAFPGRPGGGDSARKEREGGAEPQGEDGGGARSARAGRAPCGERRSASGGAAAGRRPARCGRGAPPPAGPWASDVPDAPTEPPRGRSIKGAEAARRSLPQGGERRSGARRAKRRRAARTTRPRSGPCARTGKYPKSVEGGRNAGRQAARGGAANGARRSRRRRRTALRRADGTKRTAAAHRAPRPAFRPVRLARPRIGSDSGGDGSGRGTAAGAGTGARLGRRRPTKKVGPAWNRSKRDVGPLLARNRARRARRRR